MLLRYAHTHEKWFHSIGLHNKDTRDEISFQSIIIIIISWEGAGIGPILKIWAQLDFKIAGE